MADEQDRSKRIGVTPGKLVLIGVLAVVLLGVLYVQFGAGGSAESVLAAEEAVEPLSPPTKSAAPAVANAARADVAPAASPSENQAATARTTQWSIPDVARITEHDPFALPLAFPQPARSADGKGLTAENLKATDAATRASRLADEVAKRQTALEELRRRGVSVIVKQRGQYVAMIGDRTIRVGDEINGFTVTSIEADGVRVEMKVAE